MKLRFDSVWGGGFALSKSFETGVHCLVGSFAEGPEQTFALATGARAPEHGRVTLDGAEPFRSPRVRAKIACAARSPWLPSAPNVLTAVQQLQALHAPELQSDTPRECLERVGFEHLAAKPTASLNESERRAVTLALALGLRAPRLLLLVEPWSIPGVVSRAIHESIASAARTGIVLVATEQHRIAIELGASTSVFAAGRLLDAGPGKQLATSAFGCFRISCDDPRKLATALLPLPDVIAVQSPLHSSTLEVTGSGAAALSLAILATALAQGIQVHNLVEVPAQLDVLQAAVRGRADGTYQAAYQAAWHAQMALGPQQQQAVSGLQIFGAPRATDSTAYSGRIDDGGRALPDASPTNRDPS